jgi:AraC-like DNA-binding protein
VVSYVEFRPSAELSDLVICTWERSVAPVGAPAAQRVLPDGCADLVWRGGELIVAGPDRAAFMSPLSPGETIVGLRLRPGIAGLVLGMPASELLGARPPLDAVWGRSGLELSERVEAAETAAGRRRSLEEAVLSRLERSDRPDRLVLAATRLLGLPGSRVSALSRALGSSERQLLRRFDVAVGYGPKVLDRVLRFQRFVSGAAPVSRGEEGLARLAAELGYADQAHLTRECVRLSGLTPGQFAAARVV